VHLTALRQLTSLQVRAGNSSLSGAIGGHAVGGYRMVYLTSGMRRPPAEASCVQVGTAGSLLLRCTHCELKGVLCVLTDPRAANARARTQEGVAQQLPVWQRLRQLCMRSTAALQQMLEQREAELAAAEARAAVAEARATAAERLWVDKGKAGVGQSE
jgi:hypothetical protein